MSFIVINVSQSKSSEIKLTNISAVREKNVPFTITENGKLTRLTIIINEYQLLDN